MKHLLGLFILFIVYTFSFAQDYKWAHGFGGPNFNAQGISIATDAQANVYVTGTFGDSIDFDPGAGNAVLSPEVFIAKYDSSGNYIWAKSLGGNGGSVASANLAVNETGLYLTGKFWMNVDFDPGTGVAMLSASGGITAGDDIFIARYDTAGNYIWAKRIGGVDDDESNDITIDSAGNSYFTGYFEGAVDFDPGPLVTVLSSSGVRDAFFGKLDSSGNYQWAHAIGDTSFDEGYSISLNVDASAVYIAGDFIGTADFDHGSGVQNLTAVAGDSYLAKYTNNGNYIWAGNFAGAAWLNGINISTNSNNGGDIFASGSFWGTTDFDIGTGVYNLTPSGSVDIFFARYDSTGNYKWAINIGNTGSIERGTAIQSDNQGNVFLTGFFRGTVDFDPDIAVANLTANGNLNDIFFAKYDSSGSYLWAKSMGGLYDDNPNSMDIDAAGNQYITGYFTNSMDFDPGPGSVIIFPASSENIFIAKYGPTPNSIIDAPAKGEIAISLFPNPALEYIAIGNLPNAGNATLKVTDITGKELYNSKVLSSSMTIDVSGFSEGIYFVEVFCEGKMGVRKFVKQ